ncbi:MAG: hypothetical protein EWV50_07245 [Microcystis aeruginosa Ma_MB_F_20061100_S20]|uniref:Uncharacterized protein n=1 Tax=Microcystis aeruginosa Ma_MB_F_20061100_S20D TaxID=2486253 RepID=A0A552EKM3_MICAE|nr:MAG: hypothetical protein EWV78_12390 [Microcystis aeruginosa Ma_MB_F_20061100_S20D]TRU40740.1 MAG: hypothetical protein EWV50_07245 [Microcystis aeruginosa Ma_MB_F_20061100_S20]
MRRLIAFYLLFKRLWEQINLYLRQGFINTLNPDKFSKKRLDRAEQSSDKQGSNGLSFLPITSLGYQDY